MKIKEGIKEDRKGEGESKGKKHKGRSRDGRWLGKDWKLNEGWGSRDQIQSSFYKIVLWRGTKLRGD